MIGCRFYLFYCIVFAYLSGQLGMAEIKTQWVYYQSGDDSVRAFLAVSDGEGPYPALVVIHEWWGLNAWIEGNAKKFARKGYVALAIDLYHGPINDFT